MGLTTLGGVDGFAIVGVGAERSVCACDAAVSVAAECMAGASGAGFGAGDATGRGAEPVGAKPDFTGGKGGFAPPPLGDLNGGNGFRGAGGVFDPLSVLFWFCSSAIKMPHEIGYAISQ